MTNQSLDLRVIEAAADAKDPSALWAASGFELEVFRQHLRDLALTARPVSELRAEALSEEAREALELARPLLEAPDLLERVADAIRVSGYAGDVRPALMSYICLTSRRLERPLNLSYLAQSASGKNHAAEAPLPLFPETAFYLIRAGSERALIYNDESFEHRIVIVGEVDSVPENGPAASAIRSLMTDTAMEYEVVEKDQETGSFAVRRIRKPGPTGLITTSTRPLGEQASTRTLAITLDDTPKQTRAIMHAHAEAVNALRAATDPSAFVALQRWLDLAGECRVTVPYAAALADVVPAEQVRMRRDFRQLLTVIQTIALLHQRQRQRDAKGRIVATLEDYRMARDVLLDVFTAVASGGVTKAMRETVAAVRELYVDEQPITISALAERLRLHPSSTWRRVRDAVRLGFLVNQETRKRQPTKLVPGAKLPAERAALPEPAELEAMRRRPKARDDWHGSDSVCVEPPEINANAQTPPHGGSSADSEGAFAEGSAIAVQTALQSEEPADPDSRVVKTQAPFARLQSDAGPQTHTLCYHRPPQEVDAHWRLGASTWGDSATMCFCCAGPVKAELSDPSDGRCPTCRLDRPAPVRGGHLVRFLADLGATLLEGTGAVEEQLCLELQK